MGVGEFHYHFYQSQAEKPSITETPAGDPIDLISQNFIPADAVMLIAAHESRHRTFTEWLDGSVIDENNPEKRTLELDIYDKNNLISLSIQMVLLKPTEKLK